MPSALGQNNSFIGHTVNQNVNQDDPVDLAERSRGWVLPIEPAKKAKIGNAAFLQAIAES
jgi:hypothetical protein